MKEQDYDIVFIKPVKFEDCAKCVEYIKNQKIVFVNLAGMDKERSQRILDYIAGATYIKDGNMEKPSDEMLCIIPKDKKYLFSYSKDTKTYGKYDEVEEIIPKY